MSIPAASIYGIFNTGRQGMFASQVGMRVTGQNIANVNTPGYTRQRVIFDPSAFGNGVNIRTVQQVRDKFFDAQLVNENERQGFFSARQTALTQVEQVFDETQGVGINTSLSEFFAAVQDLTTQPDGTAERETVRTRGSALGRVFAAVRTRLEQVRKDNDNAVKQVADEVNSLAQQIAALNDQILRTSSESQLPNELIDRRQDLISQLSQKIDIHTFEENGSITVLLGGGQTLIEGGKTGSLRTEINPANGGLSDVIMTRLDGVDINLTSIVGGGQLGGVMSVRDREVTDQMHNLDRLAAQIATAFNVQHRQGTGLDGISGRDFWDQVGVTSRPGEGSQGGVGLTASAIVDQSQLTMDDYEIRLHDAGGGGFTYDIVDTTRNTVVSAGNPYVPGGTVVFDGMSITLDDATGPPVDGDVVQLSSYEGMASRLQVGSAVLGSLSAIGAGLSAERGDNRNALALADLQSQRLLLGGTATFADSYSAQVASLGIESQQAQRDAENQQLVVNQVSSLIDSVSGVSLDEESTNLIQYQRAFQASARVISTVDEMLQTIVNMV